MEIRRFREEDSLEEISRIYAFCWKSDYRGIFPGDFLDSLPEDRWVPLLRADSGRLLLALEGELVEGASTYGPARDPAMVGWGEVFSIYLRPSCRRRGVGTALLSAALKELRQLGFYRAYLWVLEENYSARAFYEARGLSRSGDVREEERGGRRIRELRYTVSFPPEE